MTLPPYKPPTLKPVETMMLEIPFSGNVANGANQTFVAGPIPFPFKILKAVFVFADGANWLVNYYLLVSPNSNVSTTDVPPDTNVLGLYSPQAYIIGNNSIQEVSALFNVVDKQQYIKFHVFNGSGAARPVHARVLIIQSGER